ncbi:acyl-CoA desaturase [Saprospira sp. CCB-QB6]|uniref:fatty acid desaturase family protein n=1 Tax=Saprospira sp. CCB-QB6 TaxID=3023936 RepID=UPI00234B8E1A|nr:acyl-CoA desaturase [Saprospira sp. CCB-QB6]WCL82156.1 acyl-CoA desaturase [Saprospira sp. CCB-QB6]
MPKTIRFSLADQAKFFPTLRKRVNQHFRDKNIDRNADSRMYLKTTVMLGLYFIPFALILANFLPLWAVMISYIVMGIGLVGIGMNIMHDANHGSYSKNPTINALLGYTLNLVGGNSFTWKVQHNMMHHTYTNIYGFDEDIEDKPFLRLSPNGKLKSYHRFQHLYAPILYGLATVTWILWKDFVALNAYTKEGKTAAMGSTHSKEFWILLSTKIAYWAIFFALPIALTSYSWGFLLLGFFFMHMTASMIMTLVFQVAHVVELTDHFQPDEQNEVENVWAMHQLATTSDFARDNKLVSWFLGGLNFQVEHHLFPNICHVHYPEVAKIVKATAEEFGVPYYEFKTFGGAIKSHFKSLKALGNNELTAVQLPKTSGAAIIK